MHLLLYLKMRRPQPKPRPQAPRRISHVRSASLPINTATQRSGSSDHLPARFGKTGSALDFTGEHVLPDTAGEKAHSFMGQLIKTM